MQVGAPERQSLGPTGITGVTKGPVDVAVPPSTPAGEVLRYGLGFPFQVAPRQAGIFCNIRVEGFPKGDFENGSDVILFDDLSNISAEGAIPVSRNEKVVDPETGERRIVLKYPVTGGFVPLGAKRADGSAHPHAGTGFGICQALSYPMDEAGLFSRTSEFHQSEVHQFIYDGRRFRVLRTETKTLEVPEGEWSIAHAGITNAIPDGDDMLLAVAGQWTFGDQPKWVCGVARWRRRYGIWRPISLVTVTDTRHPWVEPSLIRDTDGALLFSARGYHDAGNLVRVWRSADGGATWEPIIEVPNAREEAPVSLNRAADGTPYIAANVMGHGRQILSIWPLDAERSGLENPIVARDAPNEFGPPPGGSAWVVDHPSAATLRLADEEWHNVLGYRILWGAESGGAEPTPQTGCYIEEVLSRGRALPVWTFELPHQ